MTVEVTQEDREAAWRLEADMWSAGGHGRITPDSLAYLNGERDDWKNVQSFALHRIEATRAAADRIVELEGQVAELWGALGNLESAAYGYASNYLLDERDDPELCAMFPNQHERIVALFDAIDAATALQHKEPKP